MPAPIAAFALASFVFALGFQVHSSFNTAPLLKRFTADISELLPVFWVGFCVGMFPASRITQRYGGLPVMGAAGLVGAIAIVVMERADMLGLALVAQLVAGAAWGCILMSAFAAAATLGHTGAEGKTTGLLFSTLAPRHLCPDDGNRYRRRERRRTGPIVALGADCVLGSCGDCTRGVVRCSLRAPERLVCLVRAS